VLVANLVFFSKLRKKWVDQVWGIYFSPFGLKEEDSSIFVGLCMSVASGSGDLQLDPEHQGSFQPCLHNLSSKSNVDASELEHLSLDASSKREESSS